jgi:hypothetical protein
MSHLWLDFRGVRDDFNRKTGIDYFENSRRATYVQRQYGIENPGGFSHYHKYGWGLTASDGPGPAVLEVNGIQRVFYDYIARGAPFGPDDGTISPWAVVASLPFAPEIVIDTLRHAIERLGLKRHSPYGFDASFNWLCTRIRKSMQLARVSESRGLRSFEDRFATMGRWYGDFI